MIDLVDLYALDHEQFDRATHFLYALVRERLDEPDTNISHQRMPSWEEHMAFINRHPYRLWYMITEYSVTNPFDYVGYVSATVRNEIGIILARSARGRGIGPEAVRQFMAMHQPLPADPSERVGKWLANINPANARSIGMFKALGFRAHQITMIHEPEEESHGKEGGTQTTS